MKSSKILRTTGNAVLIIMFGLLIGMVIPTEEVEQHNRYLLQGLASGMFGAAAFVLGTAITSFFRRRDKQR